MKGLTYIIGALGAFFLGLSLIQNGAPLWASEESKEAQVSADYTWAGSSGVETQSLAPKAGEFKVDELHSFVGFEIEHKGIGSIVGHFASFGGEIKLEEEKLKALVGWVSIDSISTFFRQRDEHLRSEEFFQSERYPRARFEATDISQDEQGNISVLGKLSMKGVTRTLELRGSIRPVLYEQEKGIFRLGLRLEGELLRKDFGINYDEQAANGEPAVGAVVKIKLLIEATAPERR